MPDRFGDAADLMELNAGVAARRVEIETQVFALGRQVFAEKPEAVAARFRYYWNGVS